MLRKEGGESTYVFISKKKKKPFQKNAFIHLLWTISDVRDRLNYNSSKKAKNTISKQFQSIHLLCTDLEVSLLSNFE